MKKFIVYGLIDPRNSQLRYVGKSCSGLNRPKSHVRCSKSEHTHKSNWIKNLTMAGFLPEIQILEEFDNKDQLCDAEQFWISYFRFVGCDLTNATNGGDGMPGFKYSDSSRQKMSQAARARPRRPQSEETRLKIQKTLLGHKVSENTKAKLEMAHGITSVQDKNGVIYRSVREAAMALGLHPTNIRKVLSGKYRQTGGHTFKKLKE